MNKVSNIAKNTSYLTLALILQKVLSFTYFALLARSFGPENLGKYYAAISFTTIFGILMDLGFVNYLTRETAKRPEEGEKLLGNILGLKLVLAGLTVTAIYIASMLLGYNGLMRDLIMVSTVAVVLDSFTATFFGIVRGHHNLKYESISSVVFQLIVIGLGGFALYRNWDLRINLAVLSVASLFNFIYSWLIVSRRFRLRLRFQLAIAPSILILRSSLPFALFAIFQRFYTYFDTVLLSLLAGDRAVGVYQVSFKIVLALQFLPMAFTASLYPALSSYWLHNREQLQVTFSRALNYLIIISLPIVVGIVIISDKVVLIFKSGYEDSIWPLRLAMLALFFVFVNFPLGSLLNACDRQGRNTRNMAIVALSSAALNCLFIPLWQATGASLVVLLTNVLMFLLGIFSIKDILPHYKSRTNWLVFLRSLGAALGMGLMIYFGKAYVNIFLLSAIGSVLYFLGLFVLGGFTKADINSIAKSFRL